MRNISIVRQNERRIFWICVRLFQIKIQCQSIKHKQFPFMIQRVQIRVFLMLAVHSQQWMNVCAAHNHQQSCLHGIGLFFLPLLEAQISHKFTQTDQPIRFEQSKICISQKTQLFFDFFTLMTLPDRKLLAMRKTRVIPYQYPTKTDSITLSKLNEQQQQIMLLLCYNRSSAIHSKQNLRHV